MYNTEKTGVLHLEPPGRWIMWRILRTATLGYCPALLDSAGEELSPTDDVTPAHLLPLDRVTVTGQADTRLLYRTAVALQLTAITAIMAVLMPEDVAPAPLWLLALLSQRAEDGPGSNPRIRPEYATHFSQLLEFGLVLRTPRAPRFRSGYFAVPKKGGEARAIFNGKRMSRRCPAPPPVHLVTTMQLLGALQDHLRAGRRFKVVSGDFRHWFHQLSAPSHLRGIFGLAMRGLFYVWTCLPMGWSWSPAIAQAYAWGALLARHPQEPALFDEDAFKDGHHMPSIVRTKDGLGFVVVCYDNFLLVTDDSAVADAFRARMERLKKNYGVEIKDDGTFVRKTHAEFETQGLEYLGIQFRGRSEESAQQVGRRGRRRSRRLTAIEWSPASLDRWERELGLSPAPSTNREMAGWLGRMFNAECLSGKPITSSKNGRILLASARRLGLAAHACGWQAPCASSATELCRLCEVWTSILDLRSHPYVALASSQVPETPLWCLATDASDNGGGWILFSRSSPLHDWKAAHEANRNAWQWEAAEMNLGIYEKEMLALQRGLHTIFRTHMVPEGHRIMVVVDNAAMAWGLRAGFTNHSFGMNVLESVANWQERMEIALVVSGDNPADCPSRGDYADLE